jgi:DNA-binding transcriptional ArsR family regulator
MFEKKKCLIRWRSRFHIDTLSGLDFSENIYNRLVVDKLSSTFAALSDPTRRMVLQRLTVGPATVNEIARPFHMTQQAVSKHLACLERSRLITKKRRGREHLCTLVPGAIKRVAEWADGYRQFWEGSFDRLDEYLNAIEGKET